MNIVQVLMRIIIILELYNLIVIDCNFLILPSLFTILFVK